MNVKKTKSSKKIVLKITMSMTDIGGESGHVMARQVQEELVRSVLGQHC